MRAVVAESLLAKHQLLILNRTARYLVSEGRSSIRSIRLPLI